MARPARNADPDKIISPARTFCATTRTSQGRPLLQSERNTRLLIDVLRSYVVAGKFRLHDFVIMPNHMHLQHREYIAQDPVKAGLVDAAEKFPYSLCIFGGEKGSGG